MMHEERDSEETKAKLLVSLRFRAFARNVETDQWYSIPPISHILKVFVIDKLPEEEGLGNR
jgi:hypothetical protein